MLNSRLKPWPTCQLILFVCINSSSIPSTLFESEIFGHKKGSLNLVQIFPIY
ncbi:MAG: sigma 54-interacting transcriptional regulator [Acidobacteriota bacterium]